MTGSERRRTQFVLMALALIGSAIAAPSVAMAQTQARSVFIDKTYQDDDGDHRYALYLPPSRRTGEKLPVMLFLHGAGERGTDGRLPTTVGLGPVIRQDSGAFPFAVLFPQAEDLSASISEVWSPGSPDAARALAILDRTIEEYDLDPSRQVLTGWSMGGFGVWSLAAAAPERWQALAPLAGGGDPAMVAPLADVPLWAFHGELDAAVRPSRSQQMIDALRAAGGTAGFTLLKGAPHDIGPLVYGSRTFQQWLLNPVAEPPTGDFLPTTDVAQAIAAAEPFVPALVVPNAAAIRLGNDTLNALSYSLSESIPSNLMRGSLGNIYDSTSVRGRSFSINFSGISYNGNLNRIRVQAYRRDRLNVQLGLSNVTLRIGATYVTGQRHSATAGPINIVIGHRAPVWLSLDVTPYVANGRIRFRSAGYRFQIPSNNWYVTRPAGVTARGFGLSEQMVSDGLVQGLYGSKARIESQVGSAVPGIIAELERRLVLPDTGGMFNGLWPLPAYQPKIVAVPSSVSVDADGVTVLLDTLVSAVRSDLAPATPQRVEPLPLTGTTLKGEQLSLGIAPKLLTPLSRLLTDAGLARINVLDIPDPAFARLADPHVLAEAIPELASLPEGSSVRAELMMTQPLQVASPAPDEGAARLTIIVPDAKFIVSVRPPNQPWQSAATFTMNLRQPTEVMLIEPSFTKRGFQLHPTEAAAITAVGTWADGIEPKNPELHGDKLASLFSGAWSGWITENLGSAYAVPDITFGNTVLRAADLSQIGDVLAARFDTAAMRVTNLSGVPLVYETKGPFSGWGGPYTLEPGKSHEYVIPYPLVYRQVQPADPRRYTLPVGFHAEYRIPRTGGAPRMFQADELATRSDAP